MATTSVPDAGSFSTTIDNPFMTLRPGTTFIYENKASGEVDTFVVTAETKVIDGVTCVAVHDSASINGQLKEDTIDWFAQDAKGNVWYFGEDTHQYEPGNPDPIGSVGSWQAGVNGATAGIAMKAAPQVGNHYAQEHAPGIAEDRGAVLSLAETVSVVYGNFDGALQTADTSPLIPGVEHKYYVPGLGHVLTTSPDGDFEALTRVIVTGTAAADQVLGYAGGDYLHGQGGQDTLLALAGNDTMAGGGGSDLLFGGDGYDRMNGGAGSDTLTGGAGGDVFVFRNLGDGHADIDTITDFRFDEVDVLYLPGGAQAVASEALHGGVWNLTLKGDGDVIRLLGVSDTDGNGHITDNLLFG